ncbi:MAG TPA: molybdopterin cofactor-binding domain-containing protein [Micropepsaceae bacterium]|nr:molybdopterin cofactor-binding domain-containing protein [Micropepsaceae bacterium]
MNGPDLTRRQFGAALGGLVIAFSMAPRLSEAAESAARLPGTLEANRRLDAWLRVDEGGTVTVFTGRVELGQGATTALAQIVAEEMDIAFIRIRMIPVDTLRSPNEGVTAGSNSIEVGGAALRSAAAEARAILIDLASQRLGVAPGQLIADDGLIFTKDGAKKTSYWELAGENPLAREATNSAPPKPPKDHKIVGQPVQRLDIADKVMGRPVFIQDLRLPGMTYGRVVRPASYGAELTRLDDSAVRKMPGIISVVRDGRFIGVVAEREEQAIAARAALAKAAVWRVPASQPEPANVHDYLKTRPNIDTKTVNEKTGTASPSVKTVEATYRKPYLAHASIGPSCGIAGFVDERLTVWSHTQGPYPLRADIAKATGMAPEKVRVIHAPGAGCYGHNGADDAALDAALLSLNTNGRLVKLQWMRDDEFGWEPFGSAMTMSARAGLSADGSIVDWQYDVWSCTHNMRPGNRQGVNLLGAWHLAKPLERAVPAEAPLPAGGGDRNAVPVYDFPNQKIIDHFIPDMPLRVSALRTLGAFGNLFALESFMDEVADAAGADPVAFRLKHLKDERGRAVLQAVAEKAGWKPGAKSDGTRGRGVAFSRYETTKTYVAVIADVVVDRASGMVRVERVTAAADAGQTINPDGLRNQIEGGIIQGTSWTLKEQVGFDKEHITSRDWVSYPILTFPEVPAVDVVLIDHPELPALGAGEASQGPISAAIANAIRHATGARLRDLPFSPDRVKAAIARG